MTTAPPAATAAAQALLSAPLIDLSRAREFLAREQLDALVVTREPNVFALTTHWPLLGRMGSPGTCYAILTARSGDPLALVMPQFSYYYVYADEAPCSAVRPFLYTGEVPGSDPADAGAAPPFTFRVVEEAGLGAKERNRRTHLAGAGPMHPSPLRALTRALDELGLAGGRIACDDPLATALVQQAAPRCSTRPGENLLRRIRLVKSPAEIALMRYAAAANAEAALAAARAARELGSLQAVRRRFFTEAAARGGVGVFMVVDGSSGERFDAPLRDGAAFMIDCVSRFHNYHGDYARTVFVGEPSRRMQEVTDAIRFAWAALREELRPGLRYSQLRSLGEEALRKGGFDVHVGFNPHSVGLWHGDDPRAGEEYAAARADITLEPGMVISVDCPVMDTGIGGTAHLEDLVLITADGFEPLNDMGHPIVVT